jgi:hypothetical protein
MPKFLKNTFLVHSVVAFLVGAPLLIIPGRFLFAVGWQEQLLQAFEWETIDPYVARMFGAALLALAWSSFRGWRATDRQQVTFLVEMELVFTVLASAGMLRHLVAGLLAERWFPLIGWATVAVLVAFAVAWLVALVKK